MHVWTIDVHVQFEFFADGLDVFQAFLEIGTGTTDPDSCLVLDQCRGDLPECTDDAFEC